MQSQFEWVQGTVEIYCLAAGLPTALIGAPLLLVVVRPRLGPAGTLAFSVVFTLVGAALGCALPWCGGAVFVLYTIAFVIASLPTPTFLSYLAHRYAVEEQARVQGLFGLCGALGGGVAVAVYAQYLYDPRAEGLDAALPFFIAFGATLVGSALFLSALWPDLPDWATVTRRRPEVMIDEDQFQLEWARAAEKETRRAGGPAPPRRSQPVMRELGMEGVVDGARGKQPAATAGEV